MKVIRDGLTAARIPNYRVRERIAVCPRCHGFVGKPSEAGLPDIMGWIPAHLLSGKEHSVPLHIEVKRPKGSVEREAQKEFIERANRDGGIAMFARDWDSVVIRLHDIGAKIPDGI